MLYRIALLPFLLFTSLLNAQVDSTFNKLSIEFGTGLYLGKSLFINQLHVDNQNKTYGGGIYFGYNFSSSQKVQLGTSYLISNSEFKIVKKNMLTSQGELINKEEFRENISLFKYSIGLMYSSKISSRSSLDFEILLIDIIDEKREREGAYIGLHDNQGNIVYGIDYSTNSLVYGIKLRYKFEIINHIHAGLGILGTTENLTMAFIENDSTFNFSAGFFLTYQI